MNIIMIIVLVLCGLYTVLITNWAEKRVNIHRRHLKVWRESAEKAWARVEELQYEANVWKSVASDLRRRNEALREAARRLKHSRCERLGGHSK